MLSSVNGHHSYSSSHLRVSPPLASVLKRWKLNWCDLWIDGSLCFYKTDSRRELEHRVSLKTACVDVRSGLECRGVSPPESNPRENLIVVQLTSGSTVNLCANKISTLPPPHPFTTICQCFILVHVFFFSSSLDCPHQQLPYGLHHAWSRTRYFSIMNTGHTKDSLS
uniref:Pleckstrin homology domain containing B1 n=1 Tax=Cyclopterus lumpus TaxID=8103 RepID=A0A8C2YXL1_CYCLU